MPRQTNLALEHLRTAVLSIGVSCLKLRNAPIFSDLHAVRPVSRDLRTAVVLQGEACAQVPPGHVLPRLLLMLVKDTAIGNFVGGGASLAKGSTWKHCQGAP